MNKLSRRTALAGGIALIAFPASAQQVQMISPQEAHAKRQARKIVLVDVRTPAEWAESGVAAGAERIAMQDPNLGAKITGLTRGDKDAPIALICRTGARSGAVAAALARAGYTNVYNVNGGMVGSPTGLGWKRSGLPVSPAR